MGANSALRKIAKTVLYPLVGGFSYKYFQAASKAWDIKKGAWTEPELDLLEFGVQPGETALDVGANFGVYAHYMSKAVGRSGKVYSFEPVPFTFETLSVVGKILGFTHNVELVEKGCGDTKGKIKFTVPVQESGAFSTGQAYIGGRNDDRAGKEQQVRWNGTRDVEADIIRLDDFLPPIEKLSLIKADIEGAELFCFRGAEKIIDSHLPTVICEINPWFLEGFDVKLHELTDFFTDKGYEIFHYTNEPTRRLRKISVEEIVEDNYVFIHPRYKERFKSVLPEKE